MSEGPERQATCFLWTSSREPYILMMIGEPQAAGRGGIDENISHWQSVSPGSLAAAAAAKLSSEAPN